MASFSRRPSRPWTIDECALFAARKEFELLKLLSTDKKALAVARRLGLHAVQPQPPPAKATAGKPAATSTRTPTADAPSAGPSKTNSRRKRSAARSARRHALRRDRMLKGCMTAICFVVKLRRHVAATRERACRDEPSDESDVGEGFFPTTAKALRQMATTSLEMLHFQKGQLKRAGRPSSPSTSSESSSTSSSKPEGAYAGNCPSVQRRRRGEAAEQDYPPYSGRM